MDLRDEVSAAHRHRRVCGLRSLKVRQWESSAGVQAKTKPPKKIGAEGFPSAPHCAPFLTRSRPKPRWVRCRVGGV